MKVKRIIREVLKNLLVLGVLFFPLSCGEEEKVTPSPSSEKLAFIITTDFETGSFSTITLDEPRNVTKNIGFVHSDTQARSYQGKIYVLNRFGQDNIQVLDPDKGFANVKQFSVGNGSNPHDIAFVSNEKAYVSRYEEETLLVVNPSTGEELDTIDLSSFADADDGIPEMDQMVIVEGKLYVSVQRLNRNDPLWPPTDASYLAVIDIETDTLIDVDEALSGVQGITLTSTNPYTSLVFDPQSGKILVGEVGVFGLMDGGIDVIDPVTNKAEGFLITEEELGGDICDVVILSPEKGYAVITDPSFNTNLVSFNPSTGKKIADILTATGFFGLADIAINEKGELYVGDRTMENPGIRVFNTEDDEEITTFPIDVGLPPGPPPNSIIFIE